MTTAQPDTEQLIRDFAEYLRKYGRKDATLASYTSDVQGFIAFVGQQNASAAGDGSSAVDWQRVDSAYLITYQQYLIEHEQAMANSVRRKILAIRQFFRFLAGAELLPDSPVEDVPVPKRDDALPEQLNYKAIAQLVSAFTSTAQSPDKSESPNEGASPDKSGGVATSLSWFKAQRDRAILALIALEGVKSTELIQLIWSHHRDGPDNPSGYLHIGGTRKRTLILNPAARQLLASYRQSYFAMTSLAGLPAVEQRVFISFKGPGGGQISPQMTRHGLKFLLYELGNLHGIEGLNAEMLRHFCIRYHLEQGMAPEELMDKLGLKRLGVISSHLRRLESGRGATP